MAPTTYETINVPTQALDKDKETAEHKAFSAGEWYFNRSASELYVFPPAGVSLAAETTEIVLTQVRTRPCSHFLYIQMANLPRQARDKHRGKRSTKVAVHFSQTDTLFDLSGKETPLLRNLYINASFYQDRLGTNIGKTQKKRVAFP